jgi:hypothetical protein
MVDIAQQKTVGYWQIFVTLVEAIGKVPGGLSRRGAGQSIEVGSRMFLNLASMRRLYPATQILLPEVVPLLSTANCK